MPAGRPRWYAGRIARAFVIVAIGLVGLAALRSMQHGAPAPRSTTDSCAPQPCAAPSGFGAYFSAVAVSDGLMTMQVAFINHPHDQGYVDYNHTSPADFQLRGGDGRQVNPVFSAACPDWGELRVKIRASAGPRRLCFPWRQADAHGAEVIWSPDLGLFFDDVQVPLG